MTGLEPSPPDGFEAFWRETAAQAQEAPLEFELKASGRASPSGHPVDEAVFRGISGEPRHGWLARADDPAAPGFVWLPPYGRWSMPPDKYGTRPGYTSLSLNFFGHGAFHEEEYTPARGYFAEGVETPESWVFRRMFQDAVLALRVLGACGAADPGRLAAAGLSQGGGMAVWLGAWAEGVRAVAADFPFLSGMPWVQERGFYRYPLKELADFVGGDEGRGAAVRRTLSYFDTVNQASFCHAPTLVVAGRKDPAVRPEQVEAVYRALPGPKEFAEVDWGHDWHESMVGRNQAWLDRWLAA